jgi:hypothetical protein
MVLTSNLRKLATLLNIPPQLRISILPIDSGCLSLLRCRLYCFPLPSPLIVFPKLQRVAMRSIYIPKVSSLL